jgi:hypothetical protein
VSHPPYPPYPPHQPYPPRPQKYRPRARTWVVGVLLLVLAAGSLAAGLSWVLAPLTREDAVFRASDGPTTVDLPAGESRALYTRGGDLVVCTATDADGRPVELRPVVGDFTYNEWTAQERFDTGAGDVTLDCSASGSAPFDADAEVRVGDVPSVGRFVTGLALAIGGPLVFGLAGFVVLVVALVLTLTRPKRPADR